MTDYEAFLRRKFDFHHDYGFDVDLADLSPCLLPHQRDIVQWAIKGGRRALFESFGLGKSVQQLEILRVIVAHLAAKGERARALIVCPLGVKQEFARDARELLGTTITFLRRSEEVGGDGLYLTNYESIRDGRLDPDLFDAVSLDEASVLRSYGSKTYQSFLGLFAGTKYRFVATATPSPNKFKELIHYAAFLGIMDSGAALTRWFRRDSTKANNLTLHPHKTDEFYVWLHSWAIFLSRPSDLGYSDEGYALPPLEIVWHELPNKAGDGGADRDGQGRIFRDAALGVSEAAREKRDTLEDRLSRLMALVDASLKDGASGESGVLRGEQGAGQGPCPPVEAGQPREGEGSRSALRSNAAASGNAAGLLPRQQGEGGGPTADLRTEEALRVDQSSLRVDVGCPRRAMPNLSEADDSAGGRPRPSDGSGSGPPVPAVQHGDWSAGRFPGDAPSGDRVSDQLIIWCDLNAEQNAIERALTERGLTFSSIHGSLDVDEAERRMEEWRDRRTHVLIGKPVMLGQGVNLQQCNTAVFIGVTHKFNNVVQASHRIHRFGQTRPCTVHFIYAESEREVVKTLRRKWAQHKELTAQMSDLIRKHGLDQTSIAKALERSLGIERVEMSGEGWTLANNDCVAETQMMAMTEPESVDLIVTSIPFGNQYEYVASYNDFGHTDDNEHFWAQMDFLTPELANILRPGRIYACHVKDRILFGNVTGAGYSTVSPFHAEALMHGLKHGFEFVGMIVVVTDVVRENNQSYRLGWSEMAKDGTKMGVGSPEYVLLFRKPQSDRSRGYADVPVVKDKDAYSRARWQVDAHAFWRSNGDRPLTAEDMRGLTTGQRMKLFQEWSLANVHDHEVHVSIGEELDGKAGMGTLPATFMMLAPPSPHPDVWTDVNRMRTLNTEQSRRDLVMHTCPLQYDIVDRLIERYSNPGELVFDPFAGLGTVPLRALRAGRRGRGVELNPASFVDSVRYLKAEEMRVGTPSLFDLIEMEATEVEAVSA